MSLDCRGGVAGVGFAEARARLALTDSSSMKITTSAFKPGESIPDPFTQNGEDQNPPLTLTDVPPDTQSIAIIMDDPDAPRGLFTHWIVFNLDPKVRELRAREEPEGGSLGRNDKGIVGYSGPKPPSGTHRYYFHAYALDARLELSRGANRAEVERAMKGHVLNQAELMGRYSAAPTAPVTVRGGDRQTGS